MVNLDMVGRLRNGRLIVYGARSAKEFPALLDSLNWYAGFDLKAQGDGYGPSDQSSFYAAKRPVLHLFTDLHEDYHRTTDDWQKINLDGLKRVADFTLGLVTALANRHAPAHLRGLAQSHFPIRPRHPAVDPRVRGLSRHRAGYDRHSRRCAAGRRPSRQPGGEGRTQRGRHHHPDRSRGYPRSAGDDRRTPEPSAGRHRGHRCAAGASGHDASGHTRHPGRLRWPVLDSDRVIAALRGAFAREEGRAGAAPHRRRKDPRRRCAVHLGLSLHAAWRGAGARGVRRPGNRPHPDPGWCRGLWHRRGQRTRIRTFPMSGR